ncbi:MAG: DUF948 domain-containing protein [Cellulosimicrobium funkei]
MLAVPLLKLGRVLDEARASIKEVTDHSVPILDESATTVATTNSQLVKVDTITTSAAQVSENVSALTGLYAATFGAPLVKVAAFTYGVRQAAARSFGGRRSSGSSASRAEGSR